MTQFDWHSDIAKQDYAKLPNRKKIKYNLISRYINSLADQNNLLKFAEIGSGPCFLRKELDPCVNITYYDKYPVDDTVNFFDLDSENSYFPLRDIDYVVFMGSLEYAADKKMAINLLSNNNNKLIIYITLPLFKGKWHKRLFKAWYKQMGIMSIMPLVEFQAILSSHYRINKLEKISWSLKRMIASYVMVLDPLGSDIH